MKYCLILVVIFLAACGSQAPSTPSEGDIQTAIAQTAAAQPQSTEQPTLGTSDTPLPVPSDTPRPTYTPKPTNTAEPTDTPLPPTAAPEPIYMSGSGDSIVDINNNFDFGIMRVRGNASNRYFGITSYGADGEPIDLLINATEPYEGTVAFDFGSGEHTTRLEISAEGDWEFHILPISEARVLSVPGTIEGKGDDVIVLSGATPDLAKIVGNASGRYFGITSYGADGEPIDLLVNATEPYEGTVIVDFDTVILEVNAMDNWKIEITTK